MPWSQAELERLRAKYADDPGGRVHDPKFARVAERIFSRGSRPAPFVGVPTFLTAPHRPVAPAAPDFSGLAFGGGFENFPVAHFRFTPSLSVDRPRAAMIVRVGFARFAIDVGADAKAKFRVFVDHLAIGRVVVHVGGDELFVFERFLDESADFFSAGAAGVRFENTLTFRGERFERKGHGSASL